MSIWVGRYAIVGGEVREHGPWLVDRQRTRDDERVRILVLAEPVGERSGEFCAEVAEAVAALFGRETLSVTGGLLRALQQAHANLGEWNRRSLREHRVAVGLTCIAIRDGEAHIAQVGPGLVLVRGPEGVQRLSTAGRDAARPLGGDEPIDPRFSVATVPDHEIMLCTSTVEDRIGSEQLLAAIEAGPERALAELFVRTRGMQDVTAALVADLDVEQQSPPPVEQLDETVEGREVILGDITSAPAVTAGDPARRRPWHRRRRKSMPVLRALPRTAGAPGGDGVALPWRAIAAVVGLVVVIALLAWAFVPGLISEDRAALFQQAITTAESQLTIAEAAPDAVSQRLALEAALTAATRAAALDPDDPRPATVELTAQAALVALDAVIEVRELTTVLSFGGSLTAPVQPSELRFGGGSLWLAETARGRVFRIDPAGLDQPREVYRAGEIYDGSAAATPLSIAWDGEAGRLLILDTARGLFAITLDAAGEPELPVALLLRDIQEIRSVAAIASYSGNLYLLDPDGGEVWRYFPAGGSFDSERAGVLGAAAELGAVDRLAVDGDVYVGDGETVRQFRQGDELDSLLVGIDRPPETAVAFVEDRERGLIYLADSAGRRVIVARRAGGFVAQYRHPGFAGLLGIALDPAVASGRDTLYLLTGDAVLAVALAEQ